MGIVAETVSRYVQLTKKGRELRGTCPFCGESRLCVYPARDDRAKQCDAIPRSEGWACFGCGLQDKGSNAESFIALANEYGLTAGKPREPIIEPLKTIRWARVLPPEGSRPDMAPKWLGKPLSVTVERDEQGRLFGYRVTYDLAGDRRWIYIRYGEHDPGMWKCRRPPHRERVIALYPEMYDFVANYINGRNLVSVRELIQGENAKGHKAKAAAFALQRLGWIRKHKIIRGHNIYYYVPQQAQQAQQARDLNHG